MYKKIAKCPSSLTEKCKVKLQRDTISYLSPIRKFNTKEYTIDFGKPGEKQITLNLVGRIQIGKSLGDWAAKIYQSYTYNYL